MLTATNFSFANVVCIVSAWLYKRVHQTLSTFSIRHPRYCLNDLQDECCHYCFFLNCRGENRKEGWNFFCNSLKWKVILKWSLRQPGWFGRKILFQSHPLWQYINVHHNLSGELGIWFISVSNHFQNVWNWRKQCFETIRNTNLWWQYCKYI